MLITTERGLGAIITKISLSLLYAIGLPLNRASPSLKLIKTFRRSAMTDETLANRQWYPLKAKLQKQDMTELIKTFAFLKIRKKSFSKLEI